MGVTSWTLIDVERDIYQDEITLGPAEHFGSAGVRLHKRVLRGGLREGVDVIDVDNGRCRVTVVPTRGMGVWRATCDGVDLGWQSPVRGPVHPTFVPLYEPSGLGWLAGFDELICRCGLENNGGPERNADGVLTQTLHGKIANTPACQVEVSFNDDAGEIIIRGIVEETRLYHQKLRLDATLRMKIDEPGFRIADEVTNLSAEPADLQLVYHINFGLPLLDEGSRVVLPAKTVVPATDRAAEGIDAWNVYGPQEAGYTEQVYFAELIDDAQGATQALLRNAAGNQGVSLHFNRQQLPYFTLWKSTQRGEDGYVTGLEPGINLPNVKSFEQSQGRVTKLAGGEARQFEIGVVVHADADSVAGAEGAIRQLQGSTTPDVIRRPTRPWANA